MSMLVPFRSLSVSRATVCIVGMVAGLMACSGGGSGGNGSNSGSPSEPEPPIAQTEHLSAGDATKVLNNPRPSAFSFHSANIEDTDVETILKFNSGNNFFEQPWVTNRGSTTSRDGLGPYFNNNACQNCHIEDGRGSAEPNTLANVFNGVGFASLLIRASRAQVSMEQLANMQAGKLANVPDPAVGGQLQQHAVLSVAREAELTATFTTETVSFSDGFEVTLRRPAWQLRSLADNQDFAPDTVFSARVAPPMIGLGMLEQISADEIRALADPDDLNQDGISGKANLVWDVEAQAVRLGRFGWKAGQPTIRQQTAGAFLGDMGLTSVVFPDQGCLAHQLDCQAAPNGNGSASDTSPYEVTDKILSNVVFYSRNLAVPSRRNAYAENVQSGKALFNQAGCQACHKASYTTTASTEHPQQSEQLIYPYTDMLLHDMGPDLADFDINNAPVGANVLVEFGASATEWRTPPLWGLGVTHIVNPEATFLHDGRARTILEAVLWHGGEAQASRDRVLQFNAQERADFLTFLNDL